MREIRQSGSEGGAATAVPTPIQGSAINRALACCHKATRGFYSPPVRVRARRKPSVPVLVAVASGATLLRAHT